jgi:hypothetical protein
MTAVRSFPDALSTSRIPRLKRWGWLEADLQRSNLTSSNSQRSTPLHAIAGILPDKPSNAPRKISSGFEAPDRLRSTLKASRLRRKIDLGGHFLRTAREVT